METVGTPDDRFEALPDRSYRAAALIFPSLVTAAGEGGEVTKLFTEAWRVLEGWEKPLLTAYGKADPVLGWADKLSRSLTRFPGQFTCRHHAASAAAVSLLS